MILTAAAIREAVENGSIQIEPFDHRLLRTNSYDWHLGERLLEVRGPLDAGVEPTLQEHIIHAEGFVLQPGVLYLGETMETTKSNVYAQFLNGDRRTGGLGIWVHISAPLGHVGHAIKWTLEISVVKPVRIYPGMIFGRLIFFVPDGLVSEYGLSDAKYAHSDGVTPSRMFEELHASTQSEETSA